MGDSTERRKKHWQQDGSVAASTRSAKQRARDERKRKEYEADRRALEKWAQGGFTSYGGDDD